MNAKELLDGGQLTDAIRSLNDAIKSNPTDVSLRVFLFQLHCYAGDLARAEKQLDVIRTRSTDVESLNGLRLFEGLVNAERSRNRLFEQGERPRFVVAPPESVVWHLDALDRMREGKFAEARSLLDQAATAHQPVHGLAGEVSFDDLRDADDILAPVLEVFSTTGYYWIPWVHIQYLEVPPPKTFLDLLWAPARLATFDGQLGEVYLPSLYPGTATAPDGPLRLGRQTDWVDAGSGIIRGVGRKSFLIGDEGRTLQDLGEVRLAFDDEAASGSRDEG